MDERAEIKKPPAAPLPQGETNENPAGVSYWAVVDEDWKTHDSDFFAQGFWALFNHRFGNWRMGVSNKFLRAPLSFIYKVWFKLVQITAGIDLPYTTKVGRRVKLEHFGAMILIARSIGDDVVIRQNTTFGVRSIAEAGGNPDIGDHVDIGAGAVILGPISIGEHAVIGANAVVLEDVPAHAMAAGVPARIIKQNPAPDGEG